MDELLKRQHCEEESLLGCVKSNTGITTSNACQWPTGASAVDDVLEATVCPARCNGHFYVERGKLSSSFFEFSFCVYATG